ncbi:hypothetical protein MMC18_008832 [Xylographa bjoerkii]|nr:hypothetical protein [Xylographa bjoerkii]
MRPANASSSDFPEGISVSEFTVCEKLESPVSPQSDPAASRSTSDSGVPNAKSLPKWLSPGRKVTTKDRLATCMEKVPAFEGESIASRHKLGTASIEGDFHKIEYGQFKGRPACLIVVDLRLAYQPDSTINSMQIDFQFQEEESRTPVSPKSAQHTRRVVKLPISKVLTPEELVGEADYSRTKKHSNIKPEIGAMGFKLGAGGGGTHVHTIRHHYWRVQGTTEDHGGVYDTFRWRVFENTESDNSVPRKVRLGMIAFHEHRPFYVNVAIEGSLRKALPFSKIKATRGKRRFDPPISQDVELLESLVGEQNLLIENVSRNRMAERQVVNLIDFSGMNDMGRSGGIGTGAGGTIVGSGAHGLWELTRGEDGTPDVSTMTARKTLRDSPNIVRDGDSDSIANSVVDTLASSVCSDGVASLGDAC